MSQQHSFGWRDLLGAVNVRDFAQMAGGELGLLATSAGLAFRALPRLPLGPLLFLGGLAMVILRLVLLTVVVVAFGGSILAISTVRLLLRAVRGTKEEA